MGNVNCDIGMVLFVPVLRTDIFEPFGHDGTLGVVGISISSDPAKMDLISVFRRVDVNICTRRVVSLKLGYIQ